MNWINLAEGGEKWLAVVNVVMDIRAPHIPEDLTVSAAILIGRSCRMQDEDTPILVGKESNLKA
jgi:hypothetical protein